MNNGYQICGKRSELDYMSVILPKLDETTGQYACPENTILCGPDEYLQSHHQTVICLNDTRDCPVTGITFTEATGETAVSTIPETLTVEEQIAA